MKELPEKMNKEFYPKLNTVEERMMNKINETLDFLAEHEVKEGHGYIGWDKEVERVLGKKPPVKEEEWEARKRCKEKPFDKEDSSIEDGYHSKEECSGSTLEELLEEYVTASNANVREIWKSAQTRTRILHTLKEMMKKEYERWQDVAWKNAGEEHLRTVKEAKRSVVEEILKMSYKREGLRCIIEVVNKDDIESYLKEL